MHSINTSISYLSRPSLLVNAARFGLGGYRRARQLPRILGQSGTIDAAAATAQLMSIEAELDEKRRNAAADYSVARHITVLSALMAEAQTLAADRHAT